MTGLGLAGVLAAHGPSGCVNSREGWVECECGERLHLPSGLTFDGYAEMWDEERRARDAHVAAAVTAWLAERLGEADVLEAVCEAIADATGNVDMGETEAALAAVVGALAGES